MPKTTTRRHIEGSDGLGYDVPTSPPDDKPLGFAKPGKCPYSRSLSYATMEYSIQLDYAGFTELLDMAYSVWDSLELDARNEKIGDGFEALVERISGLREWTGWAGVPGKYL